MRRPPFGIVLGTVLALPPASRGSAPPGLPVVVPTQRLLEAMRRGAGLRAHRHGERAAAPGRRRAAARPRGRRRGIPSAGRSSSGTGSGSTRSSPEPASPRSKAPLYVRRPYEVGQDLVVDYREEAVVDAVLQGPQPRLAANVRIFWEKGAGQPDQYSYDDTLSRPNLRVTQERLITYRLVEYEDRLWYAEVSGLHGRPTSGALGVLFRPHRRGSGRGEPERLPAGRHCRSCAGGPASGGSTGPRRSPCGPTGTPTGASRRVGPTSWRSRSGSSSRSRSASGRCRRSPD